MGIVILAFITIAAAAYDENLRSELKKGEYWKELPKGVEIFGFCLPVILFIIWGDGEAGLLKIILSVLTVFFFICIVVSQNVELKEKPLKGSGRMLPDGIRRKVIVVYVLSPFLAITILFAVGAIISLIFDMADASRKKKK